MIRKTYKKIIVCGNFIEKYEYEKPLFWGFQVKPTLKNTANEKKDRTDSSINRARQKLYKIILSNIDEQQKYKNLFVTLTFKKNVIDIKKANYEFKKFIQRFYSFMGKKYKYITVIEFQKRGAVHYHTLLFNVPYKKDLHLEITKLWKNGATDIQSIKHIKNLSAYISKYIRKGFFDKRLNTNKAYFCSRSCIYPQEWKQEKDIDKILDRNIIQLSKTTYPSNKLGQIKKSLYKLNKNIIVL